MGLLIILTGVVQAQKVIRLYPAATPGSESRTHQEIEYISPIWNTQVVTNLSQPTLTAYVPATGSREHCGKKELGGQAALSETADTPLSHPLLTGSDDAHTLNLRRTLCQLKLGARLR